MKKDTLNEAERITVTPTLCVSLKNLVIERTIIKNIQMFIRLLKFGFIGSFLQILFYWFFYKLVQTTSSLFSNSNFISDTGLVYSVGLFGFILLVQNIFVSMINNKKFTRIMIYCASALIVIAWSEDLDSRPYSTICCMLISIVTILSKTYIDKFLSYYLVEEKPNA